MTYYADVYQNSAFRSDPPREWRDQFARFVVTSRGSISSRTPTGSRRGRRSVGAAMATTVMVVAPLHLLGAMAVLVRDDLEFDTASLGLTFAMFNVGGIVASIPGGNLAERLGPRRSMITAGALTAAAALSIALLARSWWHLSAAMAVAGMANGMGQPAASLVISRGVRSHRQGLAFGMKQAAVPLAGILSGVSVPVIGLTIGWRWAYAGIALGVVAIAALAPVASQPTDPASTSTEPTSAPPGSPSTPIRRERGARVAPVMLVAFAFGSASATTIPAFLAETASDAGYSRSFAGLAVASGSTIGLISRLGVGVFADRRQGGHLKVVAAMLAIGTLGSIGLAYGHTSNALFLIGSAIAYGAGWGWPGLYLYAIVRLHPDRPGAASGQAQAGGTVGALLGPLAFGWLVTVTDFRVGWLVMAATGATASALILVSRRRLLARIAAG